MSVYKFVAGQTAPIDLQLVDEDLEPADITGYTAVTLELAALDGTAVTTTGDMTVLDAELGKVRFTPDAADLAVGTYAGRVKVVGADGSVYFWPGEDEPDVWLVGPVTV